MSWLVWRQHRQQALFALAGLAVLAAFLVPTGLQMHTAFTKAGLDDCLAAAARVEFVQVGENPDQASDQARRCQDRAERFASRFGNRGTVGILLWFLPLFAGLFWGAPLVAWTRPPASGSPGPCSTWRARRRSAMPCSPWPWGCSQVP
jgi:hypothetical protein